MTPLALDTVLAAAGQPPLKKYDVLQLDAHTGRVATILHRSLTYIAADARCRELRAELSESRYHLVAPAGRYVVGDRYTGAGAPS